MQILSEVVDVRKLIKLRTKKYRIQFVDFGSAAHFVSAAPQSLAYGFRAHMKPMYLYVSAIAYMNTLARAIRESRVQRLISGDFVRFFIYSRNCLTVFLQSIESSKRHAMQHYPLKL